MIGSISTSPYVGMIKTPVIPAAAAETVAETSEDVQSTDTDFATVVEGDLPAEELGLTGGTEEFIEMIGAEAFTLNDSPEMLAAWAETQRAMEEMAWRESEEGQAWQAEMLAEQRAQPVDLVVYQGDRIVAFRTENSGFTSLNSMGSLPDGWSDMSAEELEEALEDYALSRGYTIQTQADGLNMTNGEAVDIFNQHGM